MSRKPQEENIQQRLAAIDAEIRTKRRLLAIQDSETDLIAFMRLTAPNPEDMGDVERSLYEPAKHHHLIATALQRVERGETLRVALSVPPQHGKTRLASVGFISWFIGKHPRKNVIFGTYNETYASKIGGQVRDVLQSEQYQQVFPRVKLKKGSQSKTELEIENGGQINFIGRGGSGTGLPSDLFIIDDPLKNAEEANSPTTIEALHEWYSKVVYSRARTHTAIVIIHTRWIEDDLIGRLCDSDHPWRRTPEGAEEARKWTYINIPAVLTEGPVATAMGAKLERPTEAAVISAFGDRPMAALWPEQFSLAHLASAKSLNKGGFDALYQGRPSPEDGEFFKADWLVEHARPSDYPAPERLRFYAASDHALTEKRKNDATCMGTFGVDEKDHIWVMPELVWDRMEADRTLDHMIALMKMRRPHLWFAEDEHINKTLGPFRRTRMQEEKVYTTVMPIASTKDLRARARSIQGRLAMKMVHFPAWMPWWTLAKAELLKFPTATHDDFVSFMSLIGRGLDVEIGASAQQASNVVRFPSGSIQWIKQRAKEEAARKKQASRGGW